MKLYADFHMHGPYSRATSKNLSFENLEKYGRMKGINLIGTGDITHPIWNKEIRKKLTGKDGIYYSKTGFKFILSGEISLMYSQGGKGRRVHLHYLCPNLEVSDQINAMLLKYGRVDYDGRPIFGISCAEFVENVKKISKDVEIIPAHIWTPWFGMLGSKSGFDTVKDCFLDQTKHIYALETGLSSDPPMNERLSILDKYNLVSNSDSHSYWPWRMGRECNIMEFSESKKINYRDIILGIRNKKNWLGTIEVDPNYGIYHYDGHRNCGVSMNPKKSKRTNNICPKCKKPLTLGVLHRVGELADRSENEIKGIHKFQTVLPLTEVLSLFYGKGLNTKFIWEKYNSLISKFGTEMNIVLDVDKKELLEFFDDKKIVGLIINNRIGKINVKAGYDGVYGEPMIK